MSVIRNPLLSTDADKYAKAIDGNFYHYHDEKMTWVDAQHACSSEVRGARLPILVEEESWKAVQGRKRVWIGGSDAEHEGIWKWIYGDGIKKEITGTIPWFENEPDGGSKENYMILCGHNLAELCDVVKQRHFEFFCQLSAKGD